jgi:hypothetical protein
LAKAGFIACCLTRWQPPQEVRLPKLALRLAAQEHSAQRHCHSGFSLSLPPRRSRFLAAKFPGARSLGFPWDEASPNAARSALKFATSARVCFAGIRLPGAMCRRA